MTKEKLSGKFHRLNLSLREEVYNEIREYSCESQQTITSVIPKCVKVGLLVLRGEASLFVEDNEVFIL